MCEFERVDIANIPYTLHGVSLTEPVTPLKAKDVDLGGCGIVGAVHVSDESGVAQEMRTKESGIHSHASLPSLHRFYTFSVTPTTSLCTLRVRVLGNAVMDAARNRFVLGLFGLFRLLGIFDRFALILREKTNEKSTRTQKFFRQVLDDLP